MAMFMHCPPPKIYQFKRVDECDGNSIFRAYIRSQNHYVLQLMSLPPRALYKLKEIKFCSVGSRQYLKQSPKD